LTKKELLRRWFAAKAEVEGKVSFDLNQTSLISVTGGILLHSVSKCGKFDTATVRYDDRQIKEILSQITGQMKGPRLVVPQPGSQ